MTLIHKNLITKKMMTQRDMFYCMVTCFPSQNELNERILDVVSILECPRQCLGIYASSKGFIAGDIEWNVIILNLITGRFRLDQWKIYIYSRNSDSWKNPKRT